LEEFG
jgi:hypothetical protein